MLNNTALTIAASFAAGVVVGALGYKYVVVEKKVNPQELLSSVQNLAQKSGNNQGRGQGRGQGQGQSGVNQASQAINVISTLGKLLGTVGAVGAAGAMMRKGRK